MTIFLIVVQQMVKFLIMIMIGVVCIKTKLLKEQDLGVLSKLAMRVLLPVFILYNTVTSATRESLLAGWIVIPLSVAIFVAAIAGSFALSKICGLKGEKARIFRGAFTFNNMGLIGVPFISAVFPQAGMLFIALYTIVDQIFLWTYGYTTLTGSNEKFGLKTIKKMISPGLVCIFLGIAIVLIGIPMPTILLDTMKAVGTASTPVALAFIGGSICFCDLKSVLKKKDVYVGVLGKMLCIPLILCFIFGRLLHMDPTNVMIMSMIVGLPTMVVVPMMAKENPNAQEVPYATGLTMMTQLFSMITLPLMVLLAGFILP